MKPKLRVFLTWLSSNIAFLCHYKIPLSLLKLSWTLLTGWKCSIHCSLVKWFITTTSPSYKVDRQVNLHYLQIITWTEQKNSAYKKISQIVANPILRCLNYEHYAHGNSNSAEEFGSRRHTHTLPHWKILTWWEGRGQ